MWKRTETQNWSQPFIIIWNNPLPIFQTTFPPIPSEHEMRSLLLSILCWNKNKGPHNVAWFRCRNFPLMAPNFFSYVFGNYQRYPFVVSFLCHFFPMHPTTLDQFIVALDYKVLVSFVVTICIREWGTSIRVLFRGMGLRR